MGSSKPLQRLRTYLWASAAILVSLSYPSFFKADADEPSHTSDQNLQATRIDFIDTMCSGDGSGGNWQQGNCVIWADIIAKRDMNNLNGDANSASRTVFECMRKKGFVTPSGTGIVNNKDGLDAALEYCNNLVVNDPVTVESVPTDEFIQNLTADKCLALKNKLEKKQLGMLLSLIARYPGEKPQGHEVAVVGIICPESGRPQLKIKDYNDPNDKIILVDFGGYYSGSGSDGSQYTASGPSGSTVTTVQRR